MFAIVKDIGRNKELARAFTRMQGVYVFDDAWLVDYQFACSTLTELLVSTTLTGKASFA